MLILKYVIRQLLELFGIYRINHYTYHKYERISKKIQNNNFIFFLKVNICDQTSLMCIRKWLDVINELGRDYVFICDSKELKKIIIKRLMLPDRKKVVFVKSKRHQLMGAAKKLTYDNKRWLRMTCAHLTPFLLLKNCHNIKYAWHIDADDTFFVLETKELANAIQRVETIQSGSVYDALSLDMWASESCLFGKNSYRWTFGVALVKNSSFIFQLVSKPDSKWKNEIVENNFDAYFTWLHNRGIITTNSFYINNCYFIHCGMNLMNPIMRPFSHWKDGVLYYPIVADIYKNNKWGQYIIPKSIICVNNILSEEKSIRNLNTFFVGEQDAKTGN